jgi:alpha-L-fucosidase 2
MGNLSLSYNVSVKADSYSRFLDLSTGTYGTNFEDAMGETFTTTVFCSYPDQVCVYSLNSSTTLPGIAIKLENQFVDHTLAQSSCGAGFARLKGVTKVGSPEGMRYESVAKVLNGVNSTFTCDNQTGVLLVPKVTGQRSISVVVGAGTNYDQTKGNAANDFSFRGEDPSSQIQKIIAEATSKTLSELQKQHVEDYSRLSGAFTLELPDPRGSVDVETSLLFQRYNSSLGDPFIESLLFEYSRHLLISSSRENSLPANLQGRWSSELGAAWSADYHANINIQMNYWGAEQTGLGGDVQDGLWRYMIDTWVPRGTETAKLLYAAPGWVTHSEMNIFGHTAMKNDAQWANCKDRLTSEPFQFSPLTKLQILHPQPG